jgi:anti-sigma B factor antagonist
MQIVQQTDGNIKRITLVGSLDGKTAPELQDQALPLCDPEQHVVIDLREVGFMSSAGLRVLLLVYRQASARGGKVVLVSVSEEIREVMEMTGFLDFFTFCENLTEVRQLLA